MKWTDRIRQVKIVLVVIAILCAYTVPFVYLVLYADKRIAAVLAAAFKYFVVVKTGKFHKD